MTPPTRAALTLFGLFGLYTVGSVSGLVILRRALPTLRDESVAGRASARTLLVVALGGALYGAGFLCWLVILSRLPLAPAYAISVGLTLVASTIAGAAVLDESITPRQLLGIASVALGVFLISADLQGRGDTSGGLPSIERQATGAHDGDARAADRSGAAVTHEDGHAGSP